MVKLFCVIAGVAGSAFSVQVDEDDTVDDLKKAIKMEKTNTITCDADVLQLFLAKKDGAWIRSNDPDVISMRRGGIPGGVEELLLEEIDPAEEIGDLFGGAPTKKTIHVLVVVPQQEATVSAKKRKLADISEAITPSSFAKCRGSGSWVKWLKTYDGQIECHRVERSDDKTPLPLALLNETFARFEDNCKQIEFSKTDCEFVHKLCHGLSTPYDLEKDLAAKARELLTDYLLVDYPSSTITPATVNRSESDGSYCFGEILLLNLECKLQKGDGGGDPTMQNVAYYIKHLPRVIDRQFPCLLVDICGPLMSVFGIVNIGDEGVICEPLVASFPLFFVDNEWLLVSLTRMCASLKTAVKELTDECYQLSARRQNRATCLPATALDRLRFPYKDSVEFNGAKISYQYVEVVQRFVFKARHAENNVIIKFAKRYGKEVHEYCSRAGFAPQLLFCESLPNNWVFIVMEQLELKPLREANGTMARKQLAKIQNTLKEASFVHGDLRENNVMWDSSKNRVVLIDFDWSGKDGVDTYPPFMNGEIAWPSGAEYGKPLQVAHDAHWFDLIIDRLT